MYKLERFIFRYKDGLIPKINSLLETECEFSKINNPTLKDKDNFCLKIKYTYEYAWKTMKDFLKMNGETVLLPRKVFKAMGKYINSQDWIDLLDDINMFFTNRKNEAVLDNMIANYYSKYEKLYDDFLRFITNQDYSQEALLYNESDYVHQNHSILDTATFVKLVNFFYSHKSIKSARLYGSRASNKFRKSSDVDILIDGSYTLEEFKHIKNQLGLLSIPYEVDLTDMKNVENHLYSEIFFDRVKQASIPFYDREDFE